MTHCPAFIFSSSKWRVLLSAYFTPRSQLEFEPLVFACCMVRDKVTKSVLLAVLHKCFYSLIITVLLVYKVLHGHLNHQQFNQKQCLFDHGFQHQQQKQTKNQRLPPFHVMLSHGTVCGVMAHGYNEVTNNSGFHIHPSLTENLPHQPGTAVCSGPGSCSHSQTGRWPQRYHGASGRTFG